VSKIQPIVEGHGEVEAVPVLLRRLRDEAQAFGLDVGRPIRRNRSDLVREDPLRTAVRLALLQPDCTAVLIMFDADDDCPRELAPVIQAWAADEAGSVPVAVVMPNREYEAWFLASVESIRGRCGIRPDAPAYGGPETPRDAKGELEESMQAGRTYSPTADQASLTAILELSTAYRQSRSFRRMTRAFGLLASGAGFELADWPPSAWEQ